MKTAMIFAAGLGTRLRPLTDSLPKALVPVAGRPMLERVILRLRDAGFQRLVINVHHLAPQIIDFLEQHDNFGLDISLSDETAQLLDTGGGLQHAAQLLLGTSKNNVPHLGDASMQETELQANSFLIHNVDILSNCNLNDLMAHHAESSPQAVATLLVSPRPSTRQLLFDADHQLCGWVNLTTGQTKPAGFRYEAGRYEEYAFSGIQVVSASLLPQLPAGKYSIIDYYLSHCRELRIQSYVQPDLRLIDIGKPETLEKAEAFLG